MRIKQIESQYRRYFRAIYECEGCGNTIRKSGYDDWNFHHNVIPAMKCEKCGKSALDLGSDYRPLETKYEEWVQV